MATVGMVVHAARPRAVELARTAAEWLGERGHRVRVPEADAEATGLAPWACAEDELADDLDLALSFGGDGTMLRAVDLLAAADVPVLGVNVGHLGYLTQVEPDQLVPSLERVLAGNFEIEERMMLAVKVDGAEQPPRSALNELVVEKVASGHTVRLAVEINDRFFATYAADGMIVATPTGSTAYSLSARGPIVSPTHRALLLTPVAPHMLFDRTLVLDATESIRLEVLGPGPGGQEREPRATLSVDGRSMGMLHEGQAVVCTAGPHSARLVTFGGRDFHQILKAKFGLADR
jgi:NAD+ kinase